MFQKLQERSQTLPDLEGRLEIVAQTLEGKYLIFF